jgi:hypothetical protein
MDAMNSQDLTYQAFKLYDKIRTDSYNALVPSDTFDRLFILKYRAFYRYIRRLKLDL